MGKTQIALDRPEAAIKSLRKVVQLDPSYAEAHFVLGTALRRDIQQMESGNRKFHWLFRRKSGPRRNLLRASD
jgi:Flp pilus assembly protein TadD